MAATKENTPTDVETSFPVAGLAEALYDGVRYGELDLIDVEAILIDADEWVRHSDSAIAAQLRRKHSTTI